MAFITLIFGNGLGRAVDNDFFALEKGIEKVWNKTGSNKIKSDLKASILSCLPRVRGIKPKIPTSEDQLQTLHEVNNSCRRLRDIEPNDPKWLTNTFRGFPEAIDEFIAKVSYHFHTHPELELNEKYISFVEGVGDFIEAYTTHIATLNYDNLLYQPLIERKILSGWNGHLIDGFYNTGFSSKNLARNPDKQSYFGWYLHLHGSPLFYDDENGRIKKYSQSQLANSFSGEKIQRRHVVLRHSNDKTEVLNDSRLLRAYWSYFSKALRQSSHVYLIGYGGFDDHLNKEIGIWAEQKQNAGKSFTVKVLERMSDVEIAKRKVTWAERLSTDEYNFPISNLKMKRLHNILDFDWAHEIKNFA